MADTGVGRYLGCPAAHTADTGVSRYLGCPAARTADTGVGRYNFAPDGFAPDWYAYESFDGDVLTPARAPAE